MRTTPPGNMPSHTPAVPHRPWAALDAGVCHSRWHSAGGSDMEGGRYGGGALDDGQTEPAQNLVVVCTAVHTPPAILLLEGGRRAGGWAGGGSEAMMMYERS